MNLHLHPDVVLAWRGPNTLQIGLDLRHGFVLDNVTTGQELLIEALAGGDHSRRGLFRLARRVGVPTEDVTMLLLHLQGRGVLLGAAPRLTGPRESLPAYRASARAISLRYPDSGGWPVLQERLSRSVLLVGAGPLGARVAASLNRAGVGRVWLRDETKVRRCDVEAGGIFTSHDLGRRRQHVVAAALDGVSVATVGVDPDLAVLLADGALQPSSSDIFLRESTAHLPVILRERDAVIGPLVRPGLTCCLRCVDLYRCDRDSEWPSIASQAATHTFSPRDPLLLDLVAATAATQALDALDGRCTPLTAGVSLELSLDDPVPVLRSWPAHPRCGCTWPPPSVRRATMAG